LALSRSRLCRSTLVRTGQKHRAEDDKDNAADAASKTTLHGLWHLQVSFAINANPGKSFSNCPQANIIVQITETSR
jgi:hypothetical protein